MEKRNYSWAVFLVLIGILFLLNTTGIVGWGIWEYIARFWPIFIILLGIKIILGESVLAKSLEIFFTLFLTVSVFLIAYIQYTAAGVSFLPSGVNQWVLKGGSGIFNLSKDNSTENLEIAEDEYSEVSERKVNIDVGAGKLTLVESNSEEYIQVTQEYPTAYREPTLDESFKEGILELTYEGASAKYFNMFTNESRYDIKLGQLEVPTSIDLSLGAGDGDISFEMLPVDDFYSKVGAGDLDVSFSKYSIPSGDMFLDIGAGKMTLKLPESVGYLIEYDLGVGNINVNGRDVAEVSSRGEYTSSNYKSADVKLKLVVTVGVGSFNLRSN